MKYLILQHWYGELSELEFASRANISKYASSIGADYIMLSGLCFNENLTPPMQKLLMLDEQFDNYDTIVMVDMDAFVTKKGKDINIFTDEKGIGRHTPIQSNLLRKISNLYPEQASKNAPYWGGSIYRLELPIRQRLREHLDKVNMHVFNKPYHFEDEGVMHCLASYAGIKNTEPNLYLDGNLWNVGSFEKNVNNAFTIHIRTKVAPNGPKKSKIENYNSLVEKGLFE